MAQPVMKEKKTEINNQSGGRGADAALIKKTGPAVGRTSGNPTKSGGVFDATKGRK